jgi:hypothetical protein
MKTKDRWADLRAGDWWLLTQAVKHLSSSRVNSTVEPLQCLLSTLTHKQEDVQSNMDHR